MWLYSLKGPLAHVFPYCILTQVDHLFTAVYCTCKFIYYFRLLGGILFYVSQAHPGHFLRNKGPFIIYDRGWAGKIQLTTKQNVLPPCITKIFNDPLHMNSKKIVKVKYRYFIFDSQIWQSSYSNRDTLNQSETFNLERNNSFIWNIL